MPGLRLAEAEHYLDTACREGNMVADAEGMTMFTILMAEDDPDDRFLIEQALQDLGSGGDLRFVEDGEELMQYLRRVGKYADPAVSPRPSLIFLDLNMPKKDGRQALQEMKADPAFEAIRVVIWTTSEEREDRIQCQQAGADAYVTKPAGYAELVSSVGELIAKFTRLGWGAEARKRGNEEDVAHFTGRTQK